MSLSLPIRVIVQSLTEYRFNRLTCDFFPKPFKKEEMLSHVRSDVPTLIFQQGLDTQTPASFGRVAAHGLVNHFYLEWPSEGHVIAVRSLDGCAGDIAVSFVDDPRRQPNFDCAGSDYYRIPFEREFGEAVGTGN